MRKNRKAVAKFLFCLGILEGRVFQLFGRISEKVELPTVKFSLLYVAYDSLKNSVILGELSKSFAISEVKTKHYERILGGVWKTVDGLSKEILKKERIKEENLLSLVGKLISIYAVLLVQLKTLKFMSKEISEAYNVDMETLKGILELVIEDEETDTQVLMTIKDLFVEKPKAVTGGPLIAKYTNPDNWYGSSEVAGQ
jgi:hypothetical protein